jgi:hypothetical protein
MSVDSVAKIFECILAMQTTRLDHRQNAFDETASRYAVAIKAASPPQHGTTQQAFDKVVGRLDAFMRHERPQCRLHYQHVRAELGHARILAEAAFQQRLAQASPQRLDQGLQPAPRDFPYLEGMPRGEDFCDDAQPPPTHKDTGAAAIHDLLKITFQVCPAKLATLLGHVPIHMPTIAVQDAVDFLAQQGRQAEGTALGMNNEDGDVGRRRRPQPTQLTPEFPAQKQRSPVDPLQSRPLLRPLFPGTVAGVCAGSLPVRSADAAPRLLHQELPRIAHNQNQLLLSLTPHALREPLFVSAAPPLNAAWGGGEQQRLWH